jgi:hypothetical protein
MLTIIIIFLSMSILMAAILTMGAVPKIFRTGEQVNQTQSTLNQTQMFLQEQAARDKQTRHEDAARDSQRNQIVKETNKSLNDLEQRLVKFMNESAKRSEIGSIEREVLLDNILNISKQHTIVAKDHDQIQNDVANQTAQTYDLLDMVAKRNYQGTLDNKNLLGNLTEQVKNLHIIHNKLLKELDHN